MDSLNVALLQTSLEWENPKLNKTKFEQMLNDMEADLVVLPEMFTTGFSMNPEGLAESDDIYKWMGEQTQRGNFAIYGSVMFRQADSFVNRGIFMRPDGSFDIYDKRHTFTLAGEEKVYDRGEEQRLVKYKGWTFNLQICYDLRFPVWSRNTAGYDVLLYVANWPKPRTEAWDALLKARAIENMAYCIGVNRVGKDGNDMPYAGHSQAYDVLGNPMLSEHWEEEGVKKVTLSRKHISENRNRFKFLQDRDNFTLQRRSR